MTLFTSDLNPAREGKLRVLVLGSAGFIGKRTVEVLAASDWATPIACYRRTQPTVPPGVERLAVDATSAAGIAEALVGIDAVVNCINGDSRAIAESARCLFEGAGARQPVLRVVHLSSMAVYGNASGLISETSALSGELGPYAAAKVEAEKLALRYTNVVCLRPGVVYGVGSRQWSDGLGRLLNARRLGDLGANGQGHCNLVHVDDVVEAISAALRLPEAVGQSYNLSTSELLTWNDYLRRYAAALKVTPLPQIGPWRLRMELQLIAPILKVLELVLGKLKLNSVIRSPSLLPPSVGRLFRQPIRLDAAKAERELALRWKPIDEGLAEAAAHYRR